jgi:hypothetical protein
MTEYKIGSLRKCLSINGATEFCSHSPNGS